MKKLFVLTLGFAVLTAGSTQAARQEIHTIPIAGITATLAGCRNAPVDADGYRAARRNEARDEAERILQSIEDYQARQEAEAERMLWQDELTVEQVLSSAVGSVE